MNGAWETGEVVSSWREEQRLSLRCCGFMWLLFLFNGQSIIWRQVVLLKILNIHFFPKV